jgi:hypothetical protein
MANLLRAEWHRRTNDFQYEIVATVSADPDQEWSRSNGGPVHCNWQWHRTAFFADPDEE